MRILVGAVLAAALLGSASIAYAADATGKIKSLDMNKDRVTLDNGSSYMAPKTVKLSDFKIGEKVTVSYAKAGDKMDITSIRPAT
jgi:Cu/Ag efflux protein CusF